MIQDFYVFTCFVLLGVGVGTKVLIHAHQRSIYGNVLYITHKCQLVYSKTNTKCGQVFTVRVGHSTKCLLFNSFKSLFKGYYYVDHSSSWT